MVSPSLLRAEKRETIKGGDKVVHIGLLFFTVMNRNHSLLCLTFGYELILLLTELTVNMRLFI